MITGYFKNSLFLSNHTKTTIVTPLKIAHETGRRIVATYACNEACVVIAEPRQQSPMVLDCLRWSGRSCPGTKQMGILNSYWPAQIERKRKRKKESLQVWNDLSEVTRIWGGIASRGKREERAGVARTDDRRVVAFNQIIETGESQARDACSRGTLCGLPTFYKSRTRERPKEEGWPRTFAHFDMRLKFAPLFFSREFFDVNISRQTRKTLK